MLSFVKSADSSGMSHSSIVLLLLFSLVKVVMSGCRWSNPTWLQSLESAPKVEVTEDHVVTVGWSKIQFQDKFDCVDKFDVGVESEEVKKRICSVERKIG